MPLLGPGQSFPTLVVARPGGEQLVLPDAVLGQFGVVLFFRGAWCPYSSGSIGRLVPEDVTGMIRHIRGQGASTAA